MLVAKFCEKHPLRCVPHASLVRKTKAKTPVTCSAAAQQRSSAAAQQRSSAAAQQRSERVVKRERERAARRSVTENKQVRPIAPNSSCGGTYRGQTGSIHSPGFPGQNYPDGSGCEWFLEGPTGHFLTLGFRNFSLQGTPGCSGDHVEVREYNASGRLLGRFCGADLPPSMETSDSFAFVKFVSDASGNAAGFSLEFEASVEVCGGQLNAASGTISSPNYPNLYPHNRVCRWELVVPSGRRVTLTINDLRLEGSGSSCVHDYVEVLNGRAPDAPRLQRFCGSVPAGTQVRSSGNTMVVVFRTDASVSNGGFTASYSSDEPAECGGVLSDPAGGNLTSPGYLVTNYSNNLNCEWLVQNPQHVNSSIVVVIEDLHIQNHQSCDLDYLQLRLGDSDGELLARFCGQTTPRTPIVVFTPELWIHFQTDSSLGDLGFRAKYSFSDCGGLQDGDGGVISSPNYPGLYPSPSRCAWLLEAPPGHTIKLTFSYFNLEPHSTCGWDSVTVFNGGSPGSPVIGQYCGTTSPGTVQSGSNKLAVVFMADHSVSRGGFVASWSTDASGCGGVIHADSGTFRSPNFPQNFPANVECEWRLVAHEGNHLEMTFDPEFEIPDSSGSCQNGYVKVWAGHSQHAERLLLTGCGSVAPGPVVAPGNTMTSRFQGTGATGKGFAAAFSARCGANFTSLSGRVVSPNYPEDYPDRASCNYTIDAGAQTVIMLTFQVFQVEAHSTCRYDGLKIYSGSSLSVAMATLCGSNVPGTFSSLGPMRLHFYSDSVISDRGFLAEYRAIPCGGFYNSSAGTVSSPGLSLVNYHHNLNCSYRIRVTENRVIDLKFNTFHLEASSSCRMDYVAVYDGANASAPLLGRFCGAVMPPDLRSSTNQLFLLFRTDYSVSGVGWRATYRETLGPAQGCGGYLSMPMGMLGSPDPNHDGRYEPNMNCIWTIETPVNRVVNLTFSSFDLETSSSCRYDYIKVYDGDNMNFPLVGTFCGTSIPSFFVSSGNFLLVQLVTDGSVQRRGFNATYRSVPMVCGGSFNATSSLQVLTSPSYPAGYPGYTSCRWTLDAPPQETVRLAVQNFVLQPGQSCSGNFLQLQDWPLGDYGQSHKFCAADQHPPDFYSYGRTMLVHFKSDAFMAGNGLNFTFEIAGCSRTFEQPFGYLKSPGWPDVYPHNQDCTFILTAPQNSSISLFFNNFDLETHSSCNYDYLEVRGLEMSVRQLAQLSSDWSVLRQHPPQPRLPRVQPALPALQERLLRRQRRVRGHVDVLSRRVRGDPLRGPRVLLQPPLPRLLPALLPLPLGHPGSPGPPGDRVLQPDQHPRPGRLPEQLPGPVRRPGRLLAGRGAVLRDGDRHRPVHGLLPPGPRGFPGPELLGRAAVGLQAHLDQLIPVLDQLIPVLDQLIPVLDQLIPVLDQLIPVVTS
ncbi:cubilin-like [Cololabis saira]|uniref:cubilin-like n=1 Tax=Cololabis saira TaxID=129043 RepID=UPI002AD2A846|nr:cubilin-like [Cololabis saira]